MWRIPFFIHLKDKRSATEVSEWMSSLHKSYHPCIANRSLIIFLEEEFEEPVRSLVRRWAAPCSWPPPLLWVWAFPRMRWVDSGRSKGALIGPDGSKGDSTQVRVAEKRIRRAERSKRKRRVTQRYCLLAACETMPWSCMFSRGSLVQRHACARARAVKRSTFSRPPASKCLP